MLPRACEIILLTELPLRVDEMPLTIALPPLPHRVPASRVCWGSGGQHHGGRYSVRWRLRQAHPWLAEGHTVSACHLLSHLGLLESSLREREAKN